MNVDPSPSEGVQRLDLLLAERILQGGLRGAELYRMRQERDHLWIRGSLSLRGLHVTDEDVDAILEGRAGRFFPKQPEALLIKGLRRSIDAIDEAVELHEPLDDAAVREMHAGLVEGLEGQAGGELREGSPWDFVPGLVHPSAELVPVLLKRFGRRLDLVEQGPGFDRLHPVDQAARLFVRLASIAPFRDHNLVLACLVASRHLLSQGYPPMLPTARDRQDLEQALVGDEPEQGHRVGSLVLRGFLSMDQAA